MRIAILTVGTAECDSIVAERGTSGGDWDVASYVSAAASSVETGIFSTFASDRPIMRMRCRLVCRLNERGSRSSFIPACWASWLPFLRLQK